MMISNRKKTLVSMVYIQLSQRFNELYRMFIGVNLGENKPLFYNTLITQHKKKQS